MKLNRHSRTWSTELGQGELELRRLVSAAIAQYRSPEFEGEDAYAPAHQLHNRRRLHAHLVPFDEHGKTGPSCQIVVKDFDERGITFQHPQPLHDRRALVVLEGLNLGRIAAEVDLSWCRFSGRGQYTSGGRFVQLVDKTA